MFEPRDLVTRPSGLRLGRGRKPIVFFGALDLGMALVMASCVSLGGGPSAPPKTANVTLDYAFSAIGAPKCTGQVRWDVKPISLTGSSGSSNEITQTTEVNGQPDANHICHAGYSAEGLRYGTWQFSAQTVRVYSCRIDVTSDENVGFSEDQELCSHLP